MEETKKVIITAVLVVESEVPVDFLEEDLKEDVMHSLSEALTKTDFVIEEIIYEEFQYTLRHKFQHPYKYIKVLYGCFISY